MADEIRIPVSADTSRMEADISNAARRAQVTIVPTINARGLDSISRPLGKITGQADEFTKSMEAANARVLAFGASVGVLNAVAKAFESIVVSSIDVERTLTEIAVTSGETAKNMESLGRGIFNVAKLTGTSFKDAANAALEFSRQGAGMEESLKRAQAALVLTRTTGLDAAESVRGLTAAVSSFNDVGLDYEKVVNKLAAVDTKFAVSSKDLIEGITRSASVAQEAGVSFDELTALITTLQEKTARGGAVIGNALKTIFTRVQGRENLDLLKSLGIAVNDVEGNLLPATTIIRKLASEIQYLDDATRKSVLIKIGGGFQIDKLSAVLKDVADANGVFARSLSESQTATNQAFGKVEQLGRTTSATFDRLVLSSSELASNIGKIGLSGNLKNILGALDSAVGSINKALTGGDEGETIGNKLAQGIVAGIGNVLSGPGLLLAAGVGLKLLTNFGKFLSDSIQTQLGVNSAKKEQATLERDIFAALTKNQDVQATILSLEGNKAKQAEYILGIYREQAAFLEKMSSISKTIAPVLYEGGIRSSPEGVKEVKKAAGGYMPIGSAVMQEKKNAPAGSRIIVDNNFPMGGGKRGTMVYNSNERRIPNFAGTGGDAIIPNYRPRSAARGFIPNFANPAQNQTGLPELVLDAGKYSIAGLTIGGDQDLIRARFKRENLEKAVKSDPTLLSIFQKYGAFGVDNIPVGNVYRRENENLNAIKAKEEDIKNLFKARANATLSPKIGEFIKQELDYLKIKPTDAMDYALKEGQKFDFINDQTAGGFFEIMLKAANMDFLDDNWGQFTASGGSDERSSFDIYGLKSKIAKEYGLPEKDFNYVEVKATKKDLVQDLTRKTINELLKGGNLRERFLADYGGAKSAASGYIPNFSAETAESLARYPRIKYNLKKSLASDKKLIPLDSVSVNPNIEKIKIPKLNENESPIDYENRILKQLKESKDYKDNSSLKYKGSSAIDGFKIDGSSDVDGVKKNGSSLNFLEVKSGGYSNSSVEDKFRRAIFENYGRDNDLGKLLTTATDNFQVNGLLVTSAASGFIPNFSELTGSGAGMLYSDPDFNELGGGQSGKFLAPKSGQGFGQKIFYKPGGEKIQKEYDVNKAIKDFENANPTLFKKNAISFTNVGKTLTKNGLLAGFEREVVTDSGVDEFAQANFKNQQLKANFAYLLSEVMAQAGVRGVVSEYKKIYGPNSIGIDDVYAQNFKVNDIMQNFLLEKTNEFFSSKKNITDREVDNYIFKQLDKSPQVAALNELVGGLGGKHTMFDTQGYFNPASSALRGYIPNFAKTSNLKGFGTRYGSSIGYALQANRPLESTLDEIRGTGFTGTVVGSFDSRRNPVLDENAIVASILGNNTFFTEGSEPDAVKNLKRFVLRASSQGATTGEVNGGFFGASVLNVQPNDILEGDVEGKFKNLQYGNLGKLFSRFWRAKGLNDVWEEVKLAAIAKVYEKEQIYPSSLRKDNPDLWKITSRVRENTLKLKNAAIEGVKKYDPELVGFQAKFTSQDEELRGVQLDASELNEKNLSYLMPFSSKAFPKGVSSVGLRKAAEKKQLEEQEKQKLARRQILKTFISQITQGDYKAYSTWKGWNYGRSEEYKALVQQFSSSGGVPTGLQPWMSSVKYDPASKRLKADSNLRIPNFANPTEDFDGDGVVGEGDGIIKRLKDFIKTSVKNPIVEQLANQAIQSIFDMPEGIDAIEVIKTIKAALDAPNPERNLKGAAKKRSERRQAYLRERERGSSSAYSGYIPNYASGALMDAISREKIESGLPLSAISVVKDNRLINRQNPDGLAVINKRDEPNGKIPNFADGDGISPEKIEIIFKSLEERFNKIGEDLARPIENAARILSTTTKDIEDRLLARVEGLPAPNPQNQNNESKAAEADASGKVVDAKNDEIKSIQQSTFNIFKWQAALSFVSGVLSKFGESTKVVGEAISGLGTAVYSLQESKDLIDNIFNEGKRFEETKAGQAYAAAREAEAGPLESVGAALREKGGVAAIAGQALKVLPYAFLAFEGLDAADKIFQVLNGTVSETEKAMSVLDEATQKYGVTLNNQQKKILESISESGNVSGAGFRGFFNRSGFSTFFSSEDEKQLTDALGKTGLSNSGNRDLTRALGNQLIPIIQQKIREEKGPNYIAGPDEIKEGVNFTIANFVRDIEEASKEIKKRVPLSQQKVSIDKLEKQFGIRPENTAEFLAFQQKTSPKEAFNFRLQNVKEKIAFLERRLSGDDKGFGAIKLETDKRKLEVEKDIAELKQKQKDLEDTILNGQEVEGVNLDRKYKLFQEYIKTLAGEANIVQYAASLREEALLIESELLKKELGIRQQIKQLEFSIPTARENSLSIEKELLSTSEARKVQIDLEIKALEERRKLEGEIQNIAAGVGEERINKFLQIGASSLTEPQANEIRGTYRKVQEAEGIEAQKTAIAGLLRALDPVKGKQEEIAKQIQDRIENLILEKNELEYGVEILDRTLELNKEDLIDQENKLQTLGAQEEVLKGIYKLFSLQVELAERQSKARLRDNAQATLNAAVAKQQNFYLQAERDIISSNLDKQQKGLQIQQQRLSAIREIRDAELEISSLTYKAGRDNEYELAVQRAQNTYTDRLQDIQTKNAQAALETRRNVFNEVQRIAPQDIELQRRAAEAKTPEEYLKVIQEATELQSKGFEDTVVSAAKEFKRIVTGAANELSGKPSPIETGESNSSEIDRILREQDSKNIAADLLKLKDQKSILEQPVSPEEENDNKNQIAEIDKKITELETKLQQTRTTLAKNRAESLIVPGAIPKEKEAADREKEKALKTAEKQRYYRGGGMAAGFESYYSELDTNINQFETKLGKDIPMAFRDSMLQAMKDISGGTKSVKDALLGAATSFLQRINDALMGNMADKLTRGLLGGAFDLSGQSMKYVERASGGPIVGGSGTKDDVPAMLMGGEYVINKKAASKYGKSFLDRLNSGKIQGFANGGMVGFQEADLKDLVVNPKKYTPYGQTRVGDMSFDESGKVIGLSSYKGKEEDKQMALMKAQSDFYAKNQQTGEGGFFMPGERGAGAIMGQKNLLAYATQQTTGTQFDKIGPQGINLSAGSGNFTLFGLRNQENSMNQQYLESKQKAFDLYLEGIGATKEKFNIEEEARKRIEEFKKQQEAQRKAQMKGMLVQIGMSVGMAALGAAANSFGQGWSSTAQAAAAEGGTATFGEKLMGGFTGGTMGGETRGGLANMFSSSGYKDFSVIGAGQAGLNNTEGLAMWDSKSSSYVNMSEDVFNSRYGMAQNFGRLGYDQLGTPVTYGWQSPSSSFSAPKLNPMNLFKPSESYSSSRMNMGDLGFGGGDAKDIFNPNQSVTSLTPKEKDLYLQKMLGNRRAAGGYIPGNGMGDNVPAMLNGGEFVISKQAAQNIGYNNLQKMNSGGGGSGGASDESTSRIESKLEELVEKVSGVGTINITVNSDSSGKSKKEEEDSSENQDRQNREMARRIKEVVMGVIKEEKRLGGMLR
jgi:TP901 family phage tail tape measure protein